MASNFLSRPRIPPTTAALSAGFLGLGALHFITPFQLCEFFGVPSSPEGLQEPGALPFIYANGGREVMLGIALWIMGRQRNREGINALLYGMAVCIPVKESRDPDYANSITGIGGCTGGCVCGLDVWRRSVRRMDGTLDYALSGRPGCRADCVE